MYIKTTYGPLIDTALYDMILMQANPLLGQVEGGLALENLDFFEHQKHNVRGRTNHWSIIAIMGKSDEGRDGQKWAG